MLKRQFRTYTRKANRKTPELPSKIMSYSKQSKLSQNYGPYQKLSFAEMQNITRTMLKDPTAHEVNIGVISNIKGKMYCLKLGELSSSKDFSHYFFTNQFRRKLAKVQPLRKYSLNEVFSTTIQKF